MSCQELTDRLKAEALRLGFLPFWGGEILKIIALALVLPTILRRSRRPLPPSN